MRKVNLIFCLIFLSFALQGQSIDLKQLKGMKIRNVGPAGMSGRVTTIDVNLQNPDHIFIGTASGGAWKSESGGISWTPIFDKAPLQSVGALTINQQNPSEIWLGTGEGNPRNSHNSGEGIYKSIDGGKTWKLMGLSQTRIIHRIIIHPQNPAIVYVAAMGSSWGPNPERGIFKTSDGGKTWKKILYLNDQTGAADMVMDPSNPNKLIVAMWEFWRKPWFFNSGGAGSGLYITLDGGENWDKKGEKAGLPKDTLGRIGLAIAPSKPNTIYALVEAKKNALYKSIDGGYKWNKVSDKNIGNRPFYYSDIFVDPKNENRIFNLYSVLSKSEDGGKTFKVILPYSGKQAVHPDHHAFWIHPENPNYIIEGNDGGLNISRDGGENWQFIENLPLAQFYHINYDMDIPYNICGGMQDNGSWVGPSSVWKSGGIRNGDWQEVLFGDGFDVMLRPDNNRYGYAMFQGGNLSYFDRETGQTKFIRPTHSEDTPLRFNWNAALAQNPQHDCGLYYGSQFLHKSMDCGQTWETISPDLTTNDTTKQQQDKSGGLTIDATRAENFTTILAIAPSPLNEKVIWVGTDDGNLQLTVNGGQDWDNLSYRLPNFPKGAWIPQIEVSPHNAGEAFIVVNNYRQNDFKPYLYHTKNYGKTWKQIADKNKVTGHCLAIVQDPVEENLLFLGTDYGLFISFDQGANWNKWTHNYPSVPTRDLKIHPRDHDLIVGTFGRAAYILDDIRPLRAIAKTKGTVLSSPFKVFEPTDAYLANYASASGTRFTANAIFAGDNKAYGAKLSFWLNESLLDEDKKKKKKAKISILDKAGDTIRIFKTKVDTGLNRVQWNLSRDGVRFPSYQKIKADANTPSGRDVLPGRYKVIIEFAEQKDSSMITVLADPRLSQTMAQLIAQDKSQAELEGIVQKATDGFNRLKEAKKIVKLVGEQFAYAPDSLKKEIKTLSKPVQDSIASLLKMYRLPEGLKGIQRVPNTLNETLFQARIYLDGTNGPLNQGAKRYLDKSKLQAQGILDRINQFFDTDWKTYRQVIEKRQVPIFKTYKPLNLE
ncbi:MAG: WD40/YVTN/BNR-like repeat-containing protein [Saprospiraceae bacterium]